VWVAGQQLNITLDGETPMGKSGGAPKKAGDRRFAEKPGFKGKKSYSKKAD
jgi:hypothetical protein